MRRHQACSLSLALALVACGSDDHSRECATSADCDQAGIPGTCRPSPLSDKQWCSYPDTSCPDPPAQRWGALGGDGLARTCVDQQVTDGGVDAAQIDGAVDAPDASPTDAGMPDAMLAWQPPSMLLNVNTGETERGPTVSGDGLTLLFSRSTPTNGTDVFMATRTSTGLPFGTAAVVAEVSSALNDSDPHVSPDGLEMIFVRVQSGTLNFQFMRSTRASAAVPWDNPAGLGFGGESPSLTADGLTMYYIAQGGANCAGPTPCVKEAMRPSVGAAFAAPVEVTLSVGGSLYHNVDVSGDALRILLSDRVSGASGEVVVGTRASTGDPFGAFISIDVLDIGASPVKGAAWNPAGDEIYLSANPSATDDLFLSVLN